MNAALGRILSYIGFFSSCLVISFLREEGKSGELLTCYLSSIISIDRSGKHGVIESLIEAVGLLSSSSLQHALQHNDLAEINKS